MVYPHMEILGPSKCLPVNIRICSLIDLTFAEMDAEPVSMVDVNTSTIDILSDCLWFHNNRPPFVETQVSCRLCDRKS